MQIEKTELKEIYLERVKKAWLSSPETFPIFLAEVSKTTKEKNQKLTIKQQEAFEDVFKGEQLNKELLDKKLEELLKEKKLFTKNSMIDKETFEKAVKEMKRFLQKVRSFAPDMDIDDIGKAARNYMVYSVFNILNDKEQSCTDAIFGYSMLYPVTDNFLDDPSITQHEKKQYNKFIKDKLEGTPVLPKMGCEKRTFELLEAIEKNHPRDTDSSLYTVLLCMLEAQVYSLEQQSTKELSEKEILDISAYKGGVSVLADRMFVRKDIVEEEICFYLGLGLILQLGDDLQDIRQDKEDKSQTIMTLKSKDVKELEKYVNKLLHFTKSTIGGFNVKEKNTVEALEKICCQLILSSIYQSKEYFEKDYMDKIEKYLPVTLEFIEEQMNSFSNDKGKISKEKYLKIIDEMI